MESFPVTDESGRHRSGAGVVVITGGSSGIGRCTAALFAGRGWNVGLIARGLEGLAASSRDVMAQGASVVSCHADVTDSAALRRAASTISETLGPIDVWINCAGNGTYGRFDDVPEQEFQRVTDVTYHGTVNGTREALKHMRSRGKGTIVNVCSAIAFHGLPLMSSYAGAKAAVRAFGQAVRGELKLQRSAIRLTTVYPPAVNTPFFSHAASHMGWPARPVRPVYQPEVVAQGIWQAVASGRPEMAISGTAEAFSFMTRIFPELIAWCMGRLKSDSQLTYEQEACQLEEPSLFAPSSRVFSVHGPFGDRARRYSTQLWLDRGVTLAFDLVKRLRRPAAPSVVPSPSKPIPTESGQEPAGLVLRTGDL
jgi:short-subunit dehydrogenase